MLRLSFLSRLVAPPCYRAQRLPGESTLRTNVCRLLLNLQLNTEREEKWSTTRNNRLREITTKFKVTDNSWMRTCWDFTYSSKILFISRVKNFFLPFWSNCLDAWVQIHKTKIKLGWEMILLSENEVPEVFLKREVDLWAYIRSLALSL